MTAVAASYGADRLGDLSALTDGFSAAFPGAGIIAAAGAVLAALTLRGPHIPAPADETAVADSEPTSRR